MDQEQKQITLTYGEQLFAPIQYNSFRVGPFTLTVTVRPGETASAATARGLKVLGEVAAAAYKEARDDFFARAKDAANAARAK